jgi:alcohol dehydrogenase (cytochrome c)
MFGFRVAWMIFSAVEVQGRVARMFRCLQAGLFLLAAFAPSSLRAAGNLDWPTVNQNLASQRFVSLDEISPANVQKLRVLCEVRLNEPAWFGSGILKIDETLYVTTLRATYAVDASSCKPRWRAPVTFTAPLASRFATRGAAYLDGVLFRGTNDGQLLALDARTGRLIWARTIADSTQNESLVAAPVAWNGLVFIGTATSDAGIRGRLMAVDAISGQIRWSFQSMVMGNELGGGFWTSFSLDPDTATLYAPVTNPTPIFYPEARPGPNLHTNSVVVINAMTGELRWSYQAIPRDEHDWDLSAAPTLYRTSADVPMLAVTGKSGVVYGVDQTTRALAFSVKGTTLINEDKPLTSSWTWVCPGLGAQYNGVSRNGDLGLLYVGMVDWCRYFMSTAPTSPSDHAGGATTPDYSRAPRGRLTAMDEVSGAIRWQIEHDAPFIAGIVATTGGLVFAGDVKGQFMAVDAKRGEILKTLNVGGALNNGLISYGIKGRQYLAVAVGGSSITTDGVAGPLAIKIIGMSKTSSRSSESFSRLLPPTKPSAVGSELFLTICSNCHGKSGTGALYPSLLRNGDLASPQRLRKFLASVNPPMPKLYPGLLNGREVNWIADYLRSSIFKCGQTGSVDCRPPGHGVTQGTEEWRQIYSVLTSPRCINCHTATSSSNPSSEDYPRQTDDRRPHLFGISRGTDNKGLGNGRCETCHGLTNNPKTGAPGANNEGAPLWQLAPTSMAWESSPGQPMNGSELCQMIKDPALNGGRSLQGLLVHVTTEPLVNWAWNPGVNSDGFPRTRPPLSHESFVLVFDRWIRHGAPCPLPN